MKNKKTNVVRMEVRTYQYLNALIAEDIEKLKRHFQIACNFIPSEEYKDGEKSGIEKAHKIFSDHHAFLRKTEEQLHIAAASTYKDHPSLEMRQFWGLDE